MLAIKGQEKILSRMILIKTLLVVVAMLIVGGCRTAVSGFFEDSNVTQFSEKLDSKSTVYGSDVRVYYPGGIVSDSELVKKNNGKIVEKKGELPVKTE